MRQINLGRNVILGILLLVVLGLSMQEGQAQTTDPKTVADLQALLAKHDQAFKQQDLAAVMAVYAPGSNSVMMGTGPGERWVGRADIQAAYTQMFKDFDKGSLSSTCSWRTGGVNGNTAWLATMCKMSDSQGGKPREYELNVSAVAEKVGGQWLFRAVHFSNLTGGN